MATYDELVAFLGTGDGTNLVKRVSVAVAVKAVAIANDGAATAEQKAWAVRALGNPSGEAATVTNYVLAKNAAATVQQIVDATDETVQSAVNEAVDKLLGA